MRKQELHPRTAVINKNQKNHSKKAKTDALAWLAANFPSAFDNSLQVRPLKIGVMDDILQYTAKAAEVGISKSKLREAVVLYTRRLDYLTCLKAREMRVDLQGNIVSEVTQEEAEHAGLKIKKRVEKSLRNARKMVTDKIPHSHHSNSYMNRPLSAVAEDSFPIYPARAAGHGFQSTPVQAAKVSTVVVKHKTARQYDPDAVARLKEKLGLSRNSEEKKETTE